MNNLENTENNILQFLVWIGILLITVAAFIATYAFHFSAPVIAIVWIIWFVFSLGLAYLTNRGKQVFSFAQEAKVELDKVVWPTRQETIQTTAIVMVMVALTGFVLWGIDSGMMWIIGKLTHLG